LKRALPILTLFLGSRAEYDVCGQEFAQCSASEKNRNKASKPATPKTNGAQSAIVMSKTQWN
jgi:hypothetical protein